jgi:hypothetical protein
MHEFIKYSGWKHVSTLSGNDGYSAGGIAAFQDVLKQRQGAYSMKLVESQQFATGAVDVSKELGMIKSAGCKLIVMFAQAADVITVLKKAASLGMCKGYVWVMSELVKGQYATIDSELKSAAEKECLVGMIITTPNNGEGSTKYNEVKTRWDAMSATATGADAAAMRSNIAGCSTVKDDDTSVDTDGDVYNAAGQAGHFIWQQANRKTGWAGRECGGMGTAPPISTYVTYSYDAVIAAAHAFHAYLYNSPADASNSWNTATDTKVDGKKLLNRLLATSFTGMSGTVAFNPGNATTLFRKGDRKSAGLVYEIWNDPGAGTGIEKVATVNGNLVKLVTGKVLTYNVGGKASGAKPAIMPPCYELKTCAYVKDDTSEARAITGLSVTFTVVNLIFLVWTLSKASHPVMKSSQVKFLSLCFVGGMIVCASPIFLIGPNTASSCSTRTWVLNLAITLIFAPLYAKSYRIEKIFNNKSMMRIRVRESTLVGIVLSFLVCQAILLVIEFAVDPPMPVLGDVMENGGSTQCISKNMAFGTSAFSLIQAVFHGISCILVLHTSFRCRNVPQRYSEAIYIFLASLIAVVFAVMMFLILATAGSTMAVEPLAQLKAVALSIVGTLVTAFLFLPKVYMIQTGIQDGLISSTATSATASTSSDASAVHPDVVEDLKAKIVLLQSKKLIVRRANKCNSCATNK